MTPLRFDERGLIPVIVQDAETNEVLMHAYTSQEAYERMVETGFTHFWSRSRERIWKKGETSGNVQEVVCIQTDCDNDALLVRVKQTGYACHKNRPSCFADVLSGELGGTAAIIPELRRVIRHRKDNPKEGSYTNRLLANEDLLLKKVVEEAAELAIASKNNDPEELAWESADLIYHLLVLMESTGLPLEEIFKKLSERRR